MHGNLVSLLVLALDMFTSTSWEVVSVHEDGLNMATCMVLNDYIAHGLFWSLKTGFFSYTHMGACGIIYIMIMHGVVMGVYVTYIRLNYYVPHMCVLLYKRKLKHFNH